MIGKNKGKTSWIKGKHQSEEHRKNIGIGNRVQARKKSILKNNIVAKDVSFEQLQNVLNYLSMVNSNAGALT